jgi:hypothetical protein
MLLGKIEYLYLRLLLLLYIYNWYQPGYGIFSSEARMVDQEGTYLWEESGHG